MQDTIADLKDRYRNDSHFRAIVTQLTAFMTQQKVQPYEVRDAAFIAEMLYREMHVTPMIMAADEFRYRDIHEKTA